MKLFQKFLFYRFWRLRLWRKATILPLVAILFIFSSSSVFADSFYPTGDTRYCEFAQTPAISYSALPTNSITSGLTYDSSKVRGVAYSWITSTDFEDVGDVTYPDARRINGIASAVSLPPNSQVDLDVYYYNFSGHAINILDAIYYTSLPNLAQGDLTNLGAPGVLQTNSFKYGSNTVSRSGKALSIKNWKTIPAHSYSNLPKGERLSSFTTIQPIKILSRTVLPEFREGALYLKYKTVLQNQTIYQLKNINLSEKLLSGGIYSKTLNLSPNSTEILDYEECLCAGYSLDMAIPPLEVTDPNSHTENAGLGSSQLFSLDPTSRVFFTRRSDAGSTSGWSAIQGDFTAYGQGDFISLTLLPYKIYSKPLSISVRPDIHTNSYINDLDEKSVQSNEISKDEEMEVVVEVSNNGAFADDIEINLRFDPLKYKYIGPLENLETEDTLKITKPKIQNSEIIRQVFEFRPEENLTQGEYDTLFKVFVKDASGYASAADLNSNLTVGKDDQTESKLVNYTKNSFSFEYIDLGSSPARLATTGQFNYYLPLSFTIMLLMLVYLQFSKNCSHGIKTKN